MYYGIVGDIQFTKDEQWKDEASIERVVVTITALTQAEAEDQAEMIAEMLGGLDWLVPQAFCGRIYNHTDSYIVLTDSFLTPPKSKVEWASYQKAWVEQQKVQIDLTEQVR